MTLVKWLLLLFGSTVIVGYVTWWYRTREEPVPGRALAAGLRALALMLALLILLDPAWPSDATDGGSGDRAVLLDASFSMSRPRASGGTLWDQALDSVRDHDRVWMFGTDVAERVATDSLTSAPNRAESRLSPALRAAARSGARRLVVVTDGAITDASAAAEEAVRLGLGVSVVTLETDYPRIGIAEVRAPSWSPVGDTVDVRLEIRAAGAEADTLRVEVADETGRVLAAGPVAAPEAGRFAIVELSFPVGSPAGPRRFVARLAEPQGDLERRDDVRPFYITVAERPSAPVLISLRPDWEPSFLGPNLDRLTDAPLARYLRLVGGAVRNADDFDTTPLSALVQRARAAPLVVVHGYGADAPSWARSIVRAADRLLLIPAGDRPFRLPGWGIQVGPPAEGEWYASPEPPGSPLLLDLGTIPAEGLPPVVRVRRIAAANAWSPLELQRLRRGRAMPAVAAGSVDGRRWAIAAGEGYWRWAFRGGDGRHLYRALWTGVAAWLLEDRQAEVRGPEPESRVVDRGDAVRWERAGFDSVRVRVRAEEGPEVTSRVLGTAAESLDVALPPGRYDYLATGYRGVEEVTARGPLEVEEFSPELLPAPATLTAAEMPSRPARAPTGAGDERRRLATLAWPYLLLIGLFCAEWVVRRFIGLR